MTRDELRDLIQAGVEKALTRREKASAEDPMAKLDERIAEAVAKAFAALKDSNPPAQDPPAQEDARPAPGFLGGLFGGR